MTRGGEFLEHNDSTRAQKLVAYTIAIIDYILSSITHILRLDLLGDKYTVIITSRISSTSILSRG